MSVLGYETIEHALARQSYAEVSFGFPENREAYDMVCQAVLGALNADGRSIEQRLIRRGSIALSRDRLTQILMRLLRMGSGRKGGLQVHDLILDLRLER